MMQSEFEFHDVNVSDTGAMHTLYELYRQNFPLPDEQETPENFRLCLTLNDNGRVQTEYGPYHEFYLTIRQKHKGFGIKDKVEGGLIFGVCTSRQHQEAGFLCSVQAIYLFRSSSEALRRFLYSNRILVEQVVIKHACAACQYPRFVEVIGASTAANIAIFFEANNPVRMLAAERTVDRDLSHVHPALRYKMWRQNKSLPLDFRYIQPPLSNEKLSVNYLDLFAVAAPLDPLATAARLAHGPDGKLGVPGPMLAAHLRSFFCISVMKGDAVAIGVACMEPPTQAVGTSELLSVKEYCDSLAKCAFVAVRDEKSSEMDEIDRQACDASVAAARASLPKPKRSRTMHRAMSYWPRIRRNLETLGISIGTAAFLAAVLGLHRGAHLVEEMDLFHGALTALLFVVAIGAIGRTGLAALRQRRRDHSPIALRDALRTIARKLPEYKDRPIADVMRSILSDRATHYLTVNLPLEGLNAQQLETERPALANFIASRTLMPYLAGMDLPFFNHRWETEAARIKRALEQFPPGIIQGLYDPTPWHAYYACVFPVRPEVLDNEVSVYERLVDIEAWVDPDAASILSMPDPARADRLRAHAQSGGEICLFVSHILDRPWDEADPGTPIETLRPRLPFETAPPSTTLEQKFAPYWRTEAEFACGRMLTVIAHLALIMGRMAQNRRITTDLYCPCTILVHVPATPTAQLMQTLGFSKHPKPERESAEETGGLDGSLLRIRIEPGAFVNMIAEGNHTAANFFGLIDELAQNNRRETDWRPKNNL